MGLFTGGNDLGTLGLGLLIAGVVSGLVSGMLGVGGGLVIVPVLYHVLGSAGVPESLRIHLAVGTSLAILVPSSLSSLSSRKMAVDWELLKRWAIPMLIGVAGGAAFSALAPGLWLALIFAVVALLAAAQLGFGKEHWQLTDHPPRGVGGVVLSFGIGGLSTIMGIGGGSIAVPVMTLCGIPLPRAVGTASAFAVIVSMAGAIAAVIAGWEVRGLPAYSYGYVNLLAFGIIAPVAFGASALASHVSDATDTKRLRALFALFVAVTAVKMIWDVVG